MTGERLITGKAIPNLPARDLDSTAAMFARIAFTEASRYDGYSILVRDDIELHFYARPDHDPGSTAGQTYIRVLDVDRLYAEMCAAGFTRLPEPELRERWERGASLERITALANKPWGLREFALFDVDNNLFKIGQPRSTMTPAI